VIDQFSADKNTTALIGVIEFVISLFMQNMFPC